MTQCILWLRFHLSPSLISIVVQLKSPIYTTCIYISPTFRCPCQNRIKVVINRLLVLRSNCVFFSWDIKLKDLQLNVTWFYMLNPDGFAWVRIPSLVYMLSLDGLYFLSMTQVSTIGFNRWGVLLEWGWCGELLLFLLLLFPQVSFLL